MMPINGIRDAGQNLEFVGVQANRRSHHRGGTTQQMRELLASGSASGGSRFSSYLPENESAMLLYTALAGKAEEEIKFLEPKKVNGRDGIDCPGKFIPAENSIFEAEAVGRL